MNELKKSRGVSLSEEVWQQLGEEAKKQDRSRSWLIEKILKDYLEKQKKT